MRRFLTGLLTVVLTVGAIGPALAQQSTPAPSINDMAKMLPGSINSIMVVNAQRIRSSEIAKKDSWDTHAGEVASGLIFIPADANRVVMGAVMDYDTFDARETAVLVEMDQTPPLDVIRSVTDGTIDEIAGMKIVETPQDHYVARLDDHLIAGLRPALRPYFSRWLTSLKKRESIRVPDYLEQGINYAEELGTEVIVAFNLGSVVSPTRVLDEIQDNEQVRQASLDVKQVARQVASVKGMTLGITVRDKIYGSLKFDFSEDISSLKPLARQLVSGICERTGIHLSEFDEWNVTSDAHTVKISGDMSTESFRKIMSIVDAPHSHTTDYATHDEMKTENATDPMYVTKKYFDSVNSLVDQIAPKLSPASTYTQNANWLRKYADKIDSMGTLNVDEDMIAYGNFVSQTFRDASLLMIDSRENTKITQEKLMASGARSGGGRSGWGGGSGYRGGYRYGRWGGQRGLTGGDGSRLRRSARNKTQAEVVKSVSDSFDQIATQQRDVRQAMTEKYQTQF